MFKVTAHEVRTLKWWYTRRKSIDFNPPYQRKGNLWPEEDKAYLIDSIINEYDIPKIYLADFTFSDSPLNINKKQYAIIDGRQRLESIFDFFNNKFPLSNNFIFYNDPKLSLGGLTYSDLINSHYEIASIFEEFNIHVMSVITDDESRINDLFVRLNTSKSLTGAELRNAMTGIVPEKIRQISGHQFFKRYIKFSTKRGQDQNTAAKLLLIEFRGKFVDIKKVKLDRFVKEAQKIESDNIDRAAKRVMKTLDDMSYIFTNKDRLLSAQGIIPVYYWFVRMFGAEKVIREFLVQFNNRRIENKVIAEGNPAEADNELLRYDLMNRNTNDQGSLQGRFEILLRAFDQWLS